MADEDEVKRVVCFLVAAWLYTRPRASLLLTSEVAKASVDLWDAVFDEIDKREGEDSD